MSKRMSEQGARGHQGKHDKVTETETVNRRTFRRTKRRNTKNLGIFRGGTKQLEGNVFQLPSEKKRTLSSLTH